MSLYTHRIYNKRLGEMVKCRMGMNQVDLEEWPYSMTKISGVLSRIRSEFFQLDCLIEGDLKAVIDHPMLDKSKVPMDFLVIQNPKELFKSIGRSKTTLGCMIIGNAIEKGWVDLEK